MTRLRSLLGLAVVLAACSSPDPFEPLAAPDVVPAPATSTTADPDYQDVSLAPVEGTTTTSEVVVGPGRSTLAGRVDGPERPVEGAVVRLERLVGDASASLDVASGPDGLWQAPAVLGGRYRVRAWRPPDLAMLEPQILFVESGHTTDLALTLERFRAVAVDTAIAPDPPVVGDRANLVVRVSSQVVDDDGVVRATPRPGVAVTLATGSGWEAESPFQASTDGNGRATFTLVCRSPGPHPLMVTLPATDPPSPASPAAPPTPSTDPGATSSTVPDAISAPEVFTLDPPGCVAPPPPSIPTPDGAGPTTTGDS